MRDTETTLSNVMLLLNVRIGKRMRENSENASSDSKGKTQGTCCYWNNYGVFGFSIGLEILRPAELILRDY